jgi:hypothetical protein
MLSLALLRGRMGEGRMGETCKIERFGSRADELELASMYEFTSDWGPKEKEVLSEPLCRGLILGIGGMKKLLGGGGVEAIAWLFPLSHSRVLTASPMIRLPRALLEEISSSTPVYSGICHTVLFCWQLT